MDHGPSETFFRLRRETVSYLYFLNSALNSEHFDMLYVGFQWILGAAILLFHLLVPKTYLLSWIIDQVNFFCVRWETMSYLYFLNSAFNSEHFDMLYVCFKWISRAAILLFHLLGPKTYLLSWITDQVKIFLCALRNYVMFILFELSIQFWAFWYAICVFSMDITRSHTTFPPTRT